LTATPGGAGLLDHRGHRRPRPDRHQTSRPRLEAVACLERGFDDATTYFAFPEAHHVRIRTTNGLERLHGEIKRRTRAIGAFPDRASALRLITAVALQVTSIWSDRVYLDVSLLDDHHAAAA
jgi:putative transposase